MNEQSRQYFREFASDIIFNFPDPISVCDEGHRVVAANQSFVDIFKPCGYPLGKSLEELFGADLWKRGMLEHRVRRAFASKKRIEGFHVEGDVPLIGRRILIVRVFKIHTSPRKEYLIAFTDKTEEISEQRLIQRSKDRLLEIFDGIHDPVAVIDRDLRVVRINRSMLKTLGAASYQACLGRGCADLFHKATAGCDANCPVAKTFSAGEARQDYWMMGGVPNRLFDALTYPLRDPSGAVYAVVLFCRDISRTLEVEAELYESERARVLGSLAAGIAHEIRNPLAIISSTAQYCKSELPPGMVLQEEMDTIMRSSDHANSVINALMDYARPREVQFEVVQIDDILDQGLSLVKNRCKKGKVEIKKTIEHRLPKLKIDRQRFLQAYINILLNSLDAMPDGGTLYINAHRSMRAKVIELEIRDTGKGVPKELVGRVFQPFFSTRKEGVGLGLPLAEEIIRAHGGKLTFSGAEGKGAVVRIEIPIIGER